MELLLGVAIFFTIFGAIVSIIGHNQVKNLRKKMPTK